MKFNALVFLFALSACGRYGADYQPQLASSPHDPVRYEQDRKECISKTNEQQKNAAKNNAGAFGTAGGLIGLAIEQSDKTHIDNTPMSITDRCMAAKGYDVIIVEHCC